MEPRCDHVPYEFFNPNLYPMDLGIANYMKFLRKMDSLMVDMVSAYDIRF